MGIFNIFKRGPTLKNQNYSIKELNEYFDGLYNNGDISSNKLNSATYYACMDIRCKAIAKLPLKVYIDTGKGKEKALQHDLYDILKLRPNPYMSMHDFLFAMEFYELEYGNAYIYQDVSRKGKIKALYLLDPNTVTIYIDTAGIVSRDNAMIYVWTDPTGSQHRLRTEEICHIKNFSKDGIVGTPIKQYLAETIENEQYSLKFLNNHYKNGLSGSAVINYIGDLEPGKVEKVRQRFENMSSGIKNAGRVIPIPLGFKVEQLNKKLVDEDFFNLQGLTIRHIANAFGVKLFQLNDLERSTYGNVETQNRAFYSDTLQDELTKIEQEFDYKLLGSYDREKGLFVKFNVDSILRGDFKTRMEAYAVGVQNGIMKPSEARDKEDLPWAEGSDKLICNGNMIPIDKTGLQYGEGGEK